MAVSGAAPNQENLAPTDTAAGPLAFASLDRTYWHWFVTGSPTLMNQARDTNPAASQYFCPTSLQNEGHASMHPDVNDFNTAGRRDRLAWLVNGDASYANGLALVFMSRYCLETGIPVGFGTLYVDPFDVLFSNLMQGPIALGATGQGSVQDNFLPGNEALVDQIGDLHCQALAINATFSNYTLTNLDTFGFDLAGSTTFSINAANPANVTLVGNEREFILKNNGHGNLVANFKVGPVVLGTLTVRERTTGKKDLITVPGAATVEITTQNTDLNAINPTKGAYLLR